MRILLAALIAICPTAALADGCPYISEAGQSIQFLDDGESTVRITGDGVVLCTAMASAEGTGLRLDCDDGTGEFYDVEDGGDVITYKDASWQRTCGSFVELGKF